MQKDITLDLIKELILSHLGVPNYSSHSRFQTEQPTITVNILTDVFEFNHVIGIVNYNFKTPNINITITFNSDDNIFSVLVQNNHDHREFYFGIQDKSLDKLSSYLTA